jgi:UDP-N-acetylmuramoyl-tripeptide--D-alanyl-D-alanine ligase
MTMLTLRAAAELIPGATIVGDDTAGFSRVRTDSRTAGPGDLFVALRGERFDAHDFLDDVARRGAAAALVSRPAGDCPLPALRVADTRLALGELAHGWRRRFDIPLVTVTGSNGKTTVKEMIAAIFAAHVGEDARLATSGNFNNDIGLPLTLLRLQARHRFAVIELGMNHPGETAALARIAAPTVALVNNAQREHQEFMASVEAVALEHASVIHALADGAAAVFPADDPHAGILRVAATDRRVYDFALAGPAAVTCRRDGARTVVTTPAGSFAVTLRVLGEHNVRNALAAAAAAVAAGVPLEAIQAGLAGFEPVRGRLQVRIASVAPFAGAMVIDDTYNANPDSVRAALDVLAGCAGARIAVLGDMGEVGDHGVAFHREIGAYARERGIDALFGLGEAMRDACAAFGAGAEHFGSAAELTGALLARAGNADTTILVKGSRFMKMERVVDALASGAGQTAGAH